VIIVIEEGHRAFVSAVQPRGDHVADVDQAGLDRVLRTVEFHRAAYAYGTLRGYASGYPVVPLPDDLVRDPSDPAGPRITVVLLKQGSNVELKQFPPAIFDNLPIYDIAGLYASINGIAYHIGYDAGIPVVGEVRTEAGPMRAAAMFRNGHLIRRGVLVQELGVKLDDFDSLFGGTHRYAIRTGFGGGFPSFKASPDMETIEVVFIPVEYVEIRRVYATVLRSVQTLMFEASIGFDMRREAILAHELAYTRMAESSQISDPLKRELAAVYARGVEHVVVTGPSSPWVAKWLRPGVIGLPPFPDAHLAGEDLARSLLATMLLEASGREDG
jgi:hypothetical protein